MESDAFPETRGSAEEKTYITEELMNSARMFIDDGHDPGVVLPCLLGAFWSFVTALDSSRGDFEHFHKAKAINQFMEKTTMDEIFAHIIRKASSEGKVGNA